MPQELAGIVLLQELVLLGDIASRQLGSQPYKVHVRKPLHRSGGICLSSHLALNLLPSIVPKLFLGIVGWIEKRTNLTARINNPTAFLCSLNLLFGRKCVHFTAVECLQRNSPAPCWQRPYQP